MDPSLSSRRFSYDPRGRSGLTSLFPEEDTVMGGIRDSESMSSYSDLSENSPETLTEDSPVSFSKAETEFPVFNIEKDGDPRISWEFYYDFEVTKTEVYYKLQHGYLPTEKYPLRYDPPGRKSKNHHCGVIGCKAKPFTRHYDLERHFRTIHQRDGPEKPNFYCDYKKCNDTDPMRKDHCRVHYCEYHAEDLIKRNDQPANIQEFLADRIERLNKEWWRCSRCLQRVKVDKDSYQCPACKLPCESERKIFRQRSFTIGCSMCENALVRHESGPNGTSWSSCPTCQPGPTQYTMN